MSVLGVLFERQAEQPRFATYYFIFGQASIYFIGRLKGSDILPENPGMEIYQIKTFANSVCYKWTTVIRTLQPK